MQIDSSASEGVATVTYNDFSSSGLIMYTAAWMLVSMTMKC